MSLRETPVDYDGFVDVDDIGIDGTALLCLTNATNCCGSTQTGGAALGNWFFPNGLGVPSSGTGFYRNRGQSIVRLHRQISSQERGRFRCELLMDTIYVNICEWLNLL